MMTDLLQSSRIELEMVKNGLKIVRQRLYAMEGPERPVNWPDICLAAEEISGALNHVRAAIVLLGGDGG